MIVVTGASRGLGRAICERLLAGGAEVHGLARDSAGLPFPASDCDVRSYEQIWALTQSFKQQGRTVSALINAAGIAAMNPALTTPPERARQIVDTNLLGTIYCCQLMAPLMVRNGAGAIVNFSSLAVALGLQGEAVYAASKAGVEAYSRSLARELAGFAIRVNCIAPGPIATDMLKGVSEEQIAQLVARQILPQRFTPDAVCDLVELLLDARGASLSGQVLHVGGA